MIVDLAVEDDNRVAVVAAEGLIAAFEVDYLEAHGPERDVARLERALLIGPAVGQRGGDPPDDTSVDRAIPMSKTCNSAQDANPRSLRGVLIYIAHFH